jgi:hypothetical protein
MDTLKGTCWVQLAKTSSFVASYYAGAWDNFVANRTRYRLYRMNEAHELPKTIFSSPQPLSHTPPHHPQQLCECRPPAQDLRGMSPTGWTLAKRCRRLACRVPECRRPVPAAIATNPTRLMLASSRLRATSSQASFERVRNLPPTRFPSIVTIYVISSFHAQALRLRVQALKCTVKRQRQVGPPTCLVTRPSTRRLAPVEAVALAVRVSVPSAVIQGMEPASVPSAATNYKMAVPVVPSCSRR